MQRARRQQIEIGNESAETGNVLDPSDQGLMRRVVLVDDRGAALSAIVDNDVHLVASEAALGDGFLEGRWHRRASARRRRWQKIVGVFFFEEMAAYEILRDIGQ